MHSRTESLASTSSYSSSDHSREPSIDYNNIYNSLTEEKESPAHMRPAAPSQQIGKRKAGNEVDDAKAKKRQRNKRHKNNQRQKKKREEPTPVQATSRAKLGLFSMFPAAFSVVSSGLSSVSRLPGSLTAFIAPGRASLAPSAPAPATVNNQVDLLAEIARAEEDKRKLEELRRKNELLEEELRRKNEELHEKFAELQRQKPTDSAPEDDMCGVPEAPPPPPDDVMEDMEPPKPTVAELVAQAKRKRGVLGPEGVAGAAAAQQGLVVTLADITNVKLRKVDRDAPKPSSSSEWQPADKVLGLGMLKGLRRTHAPAGGAENGMLDLTAIPQQRLSLRPVSHQRSPGGTPLKPRNSMAPQDSGKFDLLKTIRARRGFNTVLEHESSPAASKQDTNAFNSPVFHSPASAHPVTCQLLATGPKVTSGHRRQASRQLHSTPVRHHDPEDTRTFSSPSVYTM